MPVSAPRRVLIVSHTHPRLTQGGGEIAAYETFRRVHEAPGLEGALLSHDGWVLEPRAGATFTQPFGPDEYIYAGRSFDHMLLANVDPDFAPAFAELLERLRPDVVHFHHVLGIGVEALAMVRRSLPAARILLTLHEYLLICHHHGQMVTRPDLTLCQAASPQACHRCFPEEPKSAFFLRNAWLRRFLSEVDLFIAPSRFLRDRFLAWGLPAERLMVMENPLPPASPPRAPGPPRSVPRIGFFGQVSELKGIGILMSAARLLAERGWGGVIEVHGRQYPQPPALQARLDSLMADRPNNVRICGAYDNESVSALMAACDAVVVPSIWWENSPLVVREAAAAGVTVIGADIGGVAEKLRELPGSVLFRARDPLALAEAILALPAGSVRAPRPPSAVDALSLYAEPVR